MMTKDEWVSLAGAPGWPKLKQYLRDVRERSKENIAEGNISGVRLTETILQCQLLKDLAEMDYETIEKFYEEKSSNES